MSALATACVTTSFTKPVASFQQSVNTSSAAIGGYFTNLNRFERKLYLDGLARDPNTPPLLAKGADGQPTPLVARSFQAASIRARMDALNLLGAYAQRLASLAGSDAPQQFASSANALGKDLADLDETFAKLANDPSDHSAADYAGPVSSLVGSLGKMYLEQKQDQAIRTAIDEGAPKAREIIGLIDKDLSDVVQPLLLTGLKEQLAERVVYYNGVRKQNLSLSARESLLADVAAQADAYDAVVAFAPSGLTQSMRSALDTLVAYADKPRTPQTFDELMTALETFSRNAQEVAIEVQQIRDVTRRSE